MSLVARHLESQGIATVVIGSALDVVEWCGVARFLFSDFPLGNPCGRPGDATMQREIVSAALALLEDASGPRTTVQTPFVWSQDEAWKKSYARVDPADAAKLLQAGDERRVRQEAAKEEPKK